MKVEEKAQSRDELLAQVKESVVWAATQLKSLDSEHARVGWLLEDALAYLDEIGMADVMLPVNENGKATQVEEAGKAVNADS